MKFKYVTISNLALHMMFDIGKNSVKDYLEVKKITSSPHPSLEQAIMLMAKGLGNEKHAT